MIPNFALSLSFDGIALLERVPDGWTLVGEVPLDASDLGAALGRLRDAALARADGGLRTKLVIPADQIRFMSLDDGKATLADVEAALEGKTPYTLDELAIDFEVNGGRTHVAAVAQETLNEAEAFAVEHAFNPVAFVAVPESGTFAGEVFFGTTRAAGVAEVTRDDRPVLRGTAAPAPAAPAAPVAQPAADVVTPPAADPVTAPSDDDGAVFASRSKVGTAQQGVWAASIAAQPVAPAAPVATTPEAGDVAARPAGDDAAAAPAPRAAPVPPPVAEPSFTRRKEPPAPQAGRTAAPAAPATRQGLPPPPPPLATDPRPAAATGSPSAKVPAPAAPAAKVPASSPMAAPRTASGAGRVPTPPAGLTGAVGGPVPPVAAARGGAAGLARFATMARAATTRATTARAATARADAADDTDAIALPGERGKPRFLGLIMTAILLLVLLLVGLWASTLPPGGIAAWFRGDATAVASADTSDDAAPAFATPDTATLAVTTPVASVQDTTVAAEPAVDTPATDVAATATPPRPATGQVLSPDEADRIYAATGVYQRAPRIAVTPRSAALTDLAPIDSVAAPAPLTQPEPLVASLATPDAAIPPQPTPPAPTDTFVRDARGNIAATPEGTITPQGVVVIAGSPDLRPVPRPQTAAAAAAAETPAAAPPIAPVARPATLAAGVTVTTPAPDTAAEGAVTVIAGPPPLRPVLRPTTAEEAAATLPPAPPPPAFADVRPVLRPAELAPSAAAVVIAAYTGSRPVLRPAGLAPESAIDDAVAEAAEEAVAPVADINAVAAAIAAAAPARNSFVNRTALAVSVARRPDVRPRNFAQVVARAQAAAAPAAAAAAATAPTQVAAAAATPAPPTVVAPSGPVPGGVAQAATRNDAMNMRQMNLVGVYGKPNQRRALIRMGNGRYVKVEIGSSLDGGQVTAIGDNALNFVKRGRTYALVLPG